MIEWKPEKRSFLRHGGKTELKGLRGTCGGWSFLLTPVDVFHGCVMRLYCRVTTELVDLTGEVDIKNVEEGKLLAEKIVGDFGEKGKKIER